MLRERALNSVRGWRRRRRPVRSLIDYGIDDNFIKSLAKTLQPNTSALFVLLRKAQPEKVLKELSRFRGRVLRSSLSPEQEAKLQAALSWKEVETRVPLTNASLAEGAFGLMETRRSCPD